MACLNPSIKGNTMEEVGEKTTEVLLVQVNINLSNITKSVIFRLILARGADKLNTQGVDNKGRPERFITEKYVEFNPHIKLTM